MKKAFAILGVILICCFIYFYMNARAFEPFVATAFGISEVTEKYYDGENYFLTVKLDDYYQYSNLTQTFTTRQSIYDRVNTDDYYVGASIEIGYNKDEFFNIDTVVYEAMENQNYKSCTIVGITNENNVVYR